MYGSAKVHKIVKDDLPSFRAILSAIGIPTYKLTKLLVPMLETPPINEYSINPHMHEIFLQRYCMK